MGASLGLAATLPARQALAVFAALGLGLALPYLAASFGPRWRAPCRRPGAWMDTFRSFMAFPMFATVVWLVWVLGQQSGIDGAGSAADPAGGPGRWWLWALALARSARGGLGSVLPSFSMALLAVGLWPPCHAHGTAWRSPRQRPSHRRARLATLVARRCQRHLVAGGRPVFVDFTAAWCVTCQYNKKTTLGQQPRCWRDLHAKNVALLRADWTRRDPAITAALATAGAATACHLIRLCLLVAFFFWNFFFGIFFLR